MRNLSAFTFSRTFTVQDVYKIDPTPFLGDWHVIDFRYPQKNDFYLTADGSTPFMVQQETRLMRVNWETPRLILARDPGPYIPPRPPVNPPTIHSTYGIPFAQLVLPLGYEWVIEPQTGFVKFAPQVSGDTILSAVDRRVISSGDFPEPRLHLRKKS
jgi:hypothetical protein